MRYPSLYAFFAALAISVLTIGVTISPTQAETPDGVLVVADKIDDIVSLDPAESFEFSGNDMLNNVYDTLVELDPTNLGPLVPGLAESWRVDDDGVTYYFDIRRGVTFHSGNPMTAADVAFSLQRAVILNKTPSFILTQFGFTPDNVSERIKVIGPYELKIITDKAYAPSFFYNCLTAVVASIVDRKVALDHEKNGDLGHEWLKTHTAGSGAYSLANYKPSDRYILEGNPDFWRGAAPLQRVFVRHVPEPSTQRLLLERGDVDVARRLTPVDLAGIANNPEVEIDFVRRGRIMYMALNQKEEAFNNPYLIMAFKYLVDYKGMTDSFLKGIYDIHQSFLPRGFLGAIGDHPYYFNVDLARVLLDKAGINQLDVTIFVRNDQDRLEIAQSLQNSFAKAGINATLRVGTGKEILGEYRARKHGIYLGLWGPDYPDPHTNADTFARNPDNSDEAKLTGILAWRNAWAASEVSAMTDAAVLEKDTDKRRVMYENIQRIHQRVSPFIPMFQGIEAVARRRGVNGFQAGGSIHSVFYWQTDK